MKSTWVVLAMSLLLSACGGEDVPPADRSNNSAGDMEIDDNAQADGGSDIEEDTDADAPDAPDADPDGGDMPDACPEGQERCDGQCVDLSNDLQNCGGCGQGCEAPANAQVACQERACVYTCEGGFLDPNGDLNEPGGDGCECDRAPEICDGADNDCDNLLDEEDGAPLCPARPQTVASCAGEEGCVYSCPQGRADANGDLSDPDGDGCECPLPEDTTERCDGVDNNCDGSIDEAGSVGCPSIPGAMPSACQGGVCLYACAPGSLDLNDDLNTTDSDGCEYQCTPSADPAEICDGIDNDCDGTIDNGGADLCASLDNTNKSCAGVDGCRYTCAGASVDLNGDLEARGSDGCECTPTPDPAELCDGVDNDCDGLLDQDDIASYRPLPCALQDGVCEGSVQPCVRGVHVACADQDYLQHDPSFVSDDAPELACDDLDNNCDGDPDELCCAPNMAAPRPLLAPAMPNTAQLIPRVFNTNMPHLLLITWQESLTSREDQLTTVGYVRWALFNTDSLSVVLHGTENGNTEDYQASATWDGTGYALAWVSDGVDDSISWQRYNVEGQVVRARNGLFQGDGNTIRNPQLLGLGDGSSALFWLDSGCETANATSCLKRAVLASNGVPGPVQELVALPQTQLENLTFAPSANGTTGWMAWQQRPGSGQPALRWAPLLAGAVLDLGAAQQQTYTQSLSAPALAPHSDGLMLVYQTHNGQRAQLFSIDIGNDGLPRRAPSLLTFGDSEHLFPSVAAADGRFALSWVERISQVRYALNFQALNANGTPASTPTNRFEALGLHYQPVALHTFNPYGVLSFVSTAPNFPPQRIEWSLLNLDADALCVEP